MSGDWQKNNGKYDKVQIYFSGTGTEFKNQTNKLQLKRFKCFRDCSFQDSYLYQRNDGENIPGVCLFGDCKRLDKEEQIITLLIASTGLDTVAPGSGLVCRYRVNLGQVTLLF